MELLDTVTISMSEYKRLVEDSDFLARLEAYGVDNWQGYHDAYIDSEGYFEDNDEE